MVDMNLHYSDYVRVYEFGADPRNGDLWWTDSLDDVRRESLELRTFDTMGEVVMVFHTNDHITRGVYTSRKAGFNISFEQVPRRKLIAKRTNGDRR